MLVSDLMHSCANDRVAAAAVLSIGGVFALYIQEEADRDGVTIGAYTARAVRTFAARASERDWRDLVAAVRGHDLPVLAGLKMILEQQRVRAIGGRSTRGIGKPVSSGSLVTAAVAA